MAKYKKKTKKLSSTNVEKHKRKRNQKELATLGYTTGIASWIASSFHTEEKKTWLIFWAVQ